MQIFDYIFHIEKHLDTLIRLFGSGTYLILFMIIFAETGLVVTPILPGDSLIFAVGTLAGGGYLEIWTVYLVMLSAAIIGDTANYWIGHYLGPKVFSNKNSKIFKKEYLKKTSDFYDRHGAKTIIIARFAPIVRTFAPFVAGVGKMRYNTFILYNVVGGFAWVTLLTFLGYYFGGLSFVKNNFESIILGIVFISILPMIIEYIKHKKNKK